MKPSLKAFAAGHGRAGAEPEAASIVAMPAPPVKAAPRDERVRALLERIDHDFPAGANPVLIEACAASSTTRIPAMPACTSTA